MDGPAPQLLDIVPSMAADAGEVAGSTERAVLKTLQGKDWQAVDYTARRRMERGCEDVSLVQADIVPVTEGASGFVYRAVDSRPPEPVPLPQEFLDTELLPQ